MIPSFPTEPLFLNLISPHILQKGIYGRIDNINAISRVCKAWQGWIYSDEGPFAAIDSSIRKTIQLQAPKCGKLNYLNRCLYKIGKIAFKAVKDFHQGKPLPNSSIAYFINYLNPDFAPPLQKALDIALADITKIDIVDYLIGQGADLKHNVNDPGWHDACLCNYYVYIFRKGFRVNDNWKRADLDNQIKVANLLWERGLSIHYLDRQGDSLLHYYHRFDDEEGKILQWYLDKGGDINIRNSRGLTPVQHAITPYDRSRSKNLERLIKAGASGRSPTPRGDYWLHQMMKKESVDLSALASLCLDLNPEQFFCKDAQGRRPLELAIQLNNLPMQEVLFSFAEEKGLKRDPAFQISLLKAAVNYVREQYLGRWFYYDKLNYQFTRYIFAPEHDKLLLPIQELLKKIAYQEQDPAEFSRLRDASGNTFYHHLACVCPHLIDSLGLNPELLDVFQLANLQGENVYDLKKKGLHTIEIINAIYSEDAEKVKTLLQLPLCAQITDQNGNSLLHLTRCCRHKNDKNIYKIMKMLLRHGLNPNHQNDDGETPLDYCTKWWDKRLYILLRDYGGKLSGELAT